MDRSDKCNLLKGSAGGQSLHLFPLCLDPFILIVNQGHTCHSEGVKVVGEGMRADLPGQPWRRSPCLPQCLKLQSAVCRDLDEKKLLFAREAVVIPALVPSASTSLVTQNRCLSLYFCLHLGTFLYPAQTLCLALQSLNGFALLPAPSPNPPLLIMFHQQQPLLSEDLLFF